MFRKATLFSIILALAVIAAGSYTHFIPSAMLGTLSMLKLHQGLAAVLVVMVLSLTLSAWTQKHCRPAAIGLSLAATILLGGQIALGIVTIKMQSMPLLVLGHEILAIVLLGLLFRLYLRSHVDLIEKRLGTGFTISVLLVRWLVITTIVLGSWLVVNYGSLACTTPQCHPAWWPELIYDKVLRSIHSVFVAYFGTAEFNPEVTLNNLHLVVAGLTCIVATAFMLVTVFGRYAKAIKLSSVILWLLLLSQMGLGLANVIYNQGMEFMSESMPWLHTAHNVVAALLILPLVALKVYGRYTFQVPASPSAKAIDKSQPQIRPDIIVKPVEDEVYVPPSAESLYLRLKSQLKKTRSGLGGILANLPLGGKSISADLLEEIEASLLMADVGIDVTNKIINHLSQTLERDQLKNAEVLTAALKQELLAILKPCSQSLQIVKKEGPFVILVVGVNGVGKTTTIGKLAKRLQLQGHSVMLAAGDTFRAAAVEQLQVWGQRNNIHVVAQHTGADSASVIYDAVQSAQSKHVDILIADTAGRLHTKANLMEELKKVKRIIGKLDANAPHEVLLVLDAGTGQNALSQAKLFNETVALTGLVLTKLDGTAKGGVIFPLAQQIGIPIRFIGIGEGIDDLQDFNAENFVNALFVKD